MVGELKLVYSYWSVRSDFSEKRLYSQPRADRGGGKSYINSESNLPRQSAPGLAGKVFSSYKQGLRRM